MTPTERERIESEADLLVLKSSTGDRFRDEGRKKWYIAGATAEHDKARNQAIDEAIKKLNESFAFGSIDLERHDWDEINNILESLKTKP